MRCSARSSWLSTACCDFSEVAHGVGLEGLQPAVDAVELDPEFATEAIDVLAHSLLVRGSISVADLSAPGGARSRGG